MLGLVRVNVVNVAVLQLCHYALRAAPRLDCGRSGTAKRRATTPLLDALRTHQPRRKNSSSSGSKIMKLVLAALVGCAAALAPHPQHLAPRRAVLAAPLALLLPRIADAEPESDLQRAMREAAEKKVVEPRSHGK